MEGNAFRAEHALFTTSDSSHPDYAVKATSVRIYPNDHIVMNNVTLYVGGTPVFWFPYLWQSLKTDNGFLFTPGYDSLWGGFLLTQFGFPVTDTIQGKFHFDLRTGRGAAVGLDLKSTYGPDRRSWFQFSSYYARDTSTPLTPDRYRVTFQDKTFFSDDIYAIADINKLSDNTYLHDFVPSEYAHCATAR